MNFSDYTKEYRKTQLEELRATTESTIGSMISKQTLKSYVRETDMTHDEAFLKMLDVIEQLLTIAKRQHTEIFEKDSEIA